MSLIYCLPNTGLVEHLDAHILTCQEPVAFLLTETLFLDGEKHPWRSVTFSKVAAFSQQKSNIPS